MNTIIGGRKNTHMGTMGHTARIDHHTYERANSNQRSEQGSNSGGSGLSSCYNLYQQPSVADSLNTRVKSQDGFSISNANVQTERKQRNTLRSIQSVVQEDNKSINSHSSLKSQSIYLLDNSGEKGFLLTNNSNSGVIKSITESIVRKNRPPVHIDSKMIPVT